MKTYTSEQVVDILQVREQHVRKLARSGKLPSLKMGTDWRLTEEDLLRFVESQRPTRKPETAP